MEEPRNKEITAKVSFRVDLYWRQENGDYVGRIEHLLSKQKARFIGVDGDSITTFIASHLPHITAHPKSPKPSKRLAVPQQLQIEILSEESDNPTQNIEIGKYFKAQVTLAESSFLQGDQLVCTASLNAKSIDGGEDFRIAEHAGNISADRTLTVRARADSLSPGFYHLTAKLSIDRETGLQPLVFVREDYPINVCEPLAEK